MELHKQTTKSNFSLGNISHLYLNNKSLDKVNLKNHKNLKVAYLHDNKISEIEGLEQLTNLTHLFLQWNNIKKIENLNDLVNLQKLYLSFNKIQKLENIGNLKKLKELHINGQLLPKDKEFEFDQKTISSISHNLEYLNISKLQLTTLDAIEPLINLNHLDASHNKFISIENISKPLSSLINLTDLFLEGCDAQKDLHYRDKVIAATFYLENLDNKRVTKNNRIFIRELAKRKNERQHKNMAGDFLNIVNDTIKLEQDSNDPRLKLINQELPNDIIYKRSSRDYTNLLFKPIRDLKTTSSKLPKF